MYVWKEKQSAFYGKLRARSLQKREKEKHGNMLHAPVRACARVFYLGFHKFSVHISSMTVCVISSLSYVTLKK